MHLRTRFTIALVASMLAAGSASLPEECPDECSEDDELFPLLVKCEGEQQFFKDGCFYDKHRCENEGNDTIVKQYSNKKVNDDGGCNAQLKERKVRAASKSILPWRRSGKPEVLEYKKHIPRNVGHFLTHSNKMKINWADDPNASALAEKYTVFLSRLR